VTKPPEFTHEELAAMAHLLEAVDHGHHTIALALARSPLVRAAQEKIRLMKGDLQ